MEIESWRYTKESSMDVRFERAAGFVGFKPLMVGMEKVCGHFFQQFSRTEKDKLQYGRDFFLLELHNATLVFIMQAFSAFRMNEKLLYIKLDCGYRPAF